MHKTISFVDDISSSYLVEAPLGQVIIIVTEQRNKLNVE